MSTITTTAVVNYPPVEGKPTFEYETITLKRPEPGPREVLVRMVAVGICHTDIAIAQMPLSYPKVLGHEGAGYAEAVGSDVKGVAVGDPVLLSYSYCGSCEPCKYDVTTYCEAFYPENILTPEQIWSSKTNEDVAGKFFGQSSFAQVSLVQEQSIVNVKGLIEPDELKKFCPLGCGLMTGSGAITNTAKASSRDIVLVAGIGAVGLGAIMAAKIEGCKAIIAVDRLESRLAMAKEVGATHVFNTSGLDINAETYAADMAEAIKALVPDSRINFAIDTTGVLVVINALIKSLACRGKLVQIGIPLTEKTNILPLDYADVWNGWKRIEMNLLGDCVAREQLPKMIQWYREGRFPFDKFIKFYDAKDVKQALEDMKAEVIKPILVHREDVR